MTYPNSARIRAALTSFAKGIQAMLAAQSLQDALAAAETMHAAQDCLHYLAPDAWNEVWENLFATSINTYGRSRRYRTGDQLLSSQIFTLPSVAERKARCNFDPDAMPN